MAMLPRLGEKFDLEIETVSRPRGDYRSPAYRQSGLPAAPAVMLDDALIIQGCPISEEALESAIRRHVATH